MTFERTGSGQSNRSIFFGVDYICYVEGSTENDFGPDVVFWKNVFAALQPTKKIHFSCRGGKPVLERLAMEVVEQDVEKTIVAMDADYAEFLTGRYINHRCVFYTFGYSFENDIFSFDNVLETFRVLSRMHSVSSDVQSFLRAAFDKTFKELRVPMLADFHALRAGSSVLPRDKPGRIISRDQTTNLPMVNKSECAKIISLVNVATKPRTFADYSRMPNAVAKSCVGHILELVVHYTINAAIKNFVSNKNIAKDQLKDVAIQCFKDLLKSENNNDVLEHHRMQCGRLV
ncbi:DUF4435 domain-containing protein [Novosphingobium sp. Chol11]|uniref:DUF4435 domain-containing protein n=1 Tax=Novosphingobium sp. Chol11 TaxID=1385763 RepID=UPI000BE456B3|nr:DUF4435 domain-containing protein [Novosphingobium sp. Chol11]